MFDTHKTRMIGLPSGKETMTIFSAVFVENRNATDRCTDSIARQYAIADV